MNERIKQLAEQAGITTNLDTDFFEKDPNKWVDYFAEKFAELIVKECCFTGEQWADGLIDPKHYAFVNKMIQEHFGVK